MRYHKPMTRNSKSQHLIGIGPQSQSLGGMGANCSSAGWSDTAPIAGLSASGLAGFNTSLGSMYTE